MSVEKMARLGKALMVLVFGGVAAMLLLLFLGSALYALVTR